MDRYRKTIFAMVGIYCRDKHGGGGRLCVDCLELLEYANERLEKCPFGAGKPSCNKCEVHCYKPEMRERVVEVMRYSGPRMIKRHPYLAVMHLFDGGKGKKGE